jgi:peptide/nickel transport system ATP-binding protein
VRARTVNLVDIRGLHVGYRTFEGATQVLNGVNFSVQAGERVAIVGETGCGKTTTVKAILKILAPQARITGGQIFFDGKDVLQMGAQEIRRLRGSGISMIFQDPMLALNPVFTVGSLLDAVISNSGQEGAEKKETRRELAIKALSETSLADPERILASYPFQLSGGMRQRICIAMAMATPRKLVIADEPTTNLDVTIQDQVLKLLKARVEERQTSLILITHSLGVARETASRVYVMYAGSMVETGPTAEIFQKPLHPYTKALLDCIPKLSGGGVAEGIPGRLPSYRSPPPGCRYAPRCPQATERCTREKPEFVTVEQGREAACFLYGAGSGISGGGL